MRQHRHVELGAALLLACGCVLLAGGCRRPAATLQQSPLPSPKQRSLTIFLAAGMHQVLQELAEATQADDPGLRVVLEASGSLEAARKLTDYKRMADLVVLADETLMDALLIPQYASWSLSFCTDELVLAYSENSRYAAEIDEDNWPEVLLRPDVRICRADENLAPIGYRTLLAWKLADLHYHDRLGGRSLSAELSARVGPELIRPDIEELVPLLGTEADYTIIHRSTALEHNLQYVALPPEVNLADPKLADVYAQAKVTLKQPSGDTQEITASPIVFALTIPSRAENPTDAISFIERLLGSDEAVATLSDHGFRPMRPASCRQVDALPEGLRRFVAEAAE